MKMQFDPTPAGVRIGLLLLLVTLSVATAQGDPFANPAQPEAVASSLEQYSGVAFTATDNGNGVVPGVDIIQMMHQCQQPFGQIKDGMLYIHGFDYVDTNVYRLQGPRALGTAEAAATLRAQGAAAAFINGLKVWSKKTLQDESTSQSAGQAIGAGPDAKLQASVSTSTMQRLSNVTQSETSAFLKGGRTIGVKVVGLGNDGFCVVLRYAIPVDQAHFDPATAGSSAGTAAGGNTDGYPVPPPSQSGDF